MKIDRLATIAALPLLLGGLLLPPRDGQCRDGRASGTSAAQAGLISSGRAAGLARSATGGRVLDVKLQRKGAPRYRVKMLVDGKRVRIIEVDARSGALLD